MTRRSAALDHLAVARCDRLGLFARDRTRRDPLAGNSISAFARGFNPASALLRAAPSAKFPTLSALLPALAMAALWDSVVDDAVRYLHPDDSNRMRLALGTHGVRFSHGYDARFERFFVFDSDRQEIHSFDVGGGKQYSSHEYADWFCQIIGTADHSTTGASG